MEDGKSIHYSDLSLLSTKIVRGRSLTHMSIQQIAKLQPQSSEDALCLIDGLAGGFKVDLAFDHTFLNSETWHYTETHFGRQALLLRFHTGH